MKDGHKKAPADASTDKGMWLLPREHIYYTAFPQKLQEGGCVNE